MILHETQEVGTCGGAHSKKTLIIKLNHYPIKNTKMKQPIENDKMTKEKKTTTKRRLVYCCNSK
jgi:hypothetical protein